MRWSGAVAAVATAVLLAGCGGATEAAAPRPAVRRTWDQSHHVDLPPGWTVTARNIGTTDESTSLDGPGDAGCLVYSSLEEPDRYHRPRRPEEVEVQGRAAEVGEPDPDYSHYPRAVLWRAAQGRWFSVSCTVDRAELLRVAAGVQVGTNPVLVPYRLTSAVDRATMTQLIERVEGSRRTVTAQFEVPGPQRPLTMEVTTVRDPAVLRGSVERRVIAGRTVEVRAASQTICLPTRTAPVCVSGPGDEPASGWSAPDARRVAEETAGRLVPAADPEDRSTWSDADEAFPF